MNDSGFVSHCLELLAPLGHTSSRRMFGGRALYVDDLSFPGMIHGATVRSLSLIHISEPTRPY